MSFSSDEEFYDAHSLSSLNEDATIWADPRGASPSATTGTGNDAEAAPLIVSLSHLEFVGHPNHDVCTVPFAVSLRTAKIYSAALLLYRPSHSVQWFHHALY